MTKKQTIVDMDKVRGPIVSVWGQIAADAVELGRLSNAGAVELCIDADRLTFFAYGDRGKQAAAEAEAELENAIKAHGYTKVLKVLARSIRLV